MPRTTDYKFLQYNSFFKVILLTDAHQVGKITMLHYLAQGKDRSYASLDDSPVRQIAKEDPYWASLRISSNGSDR